MKLLNIFRSIGVTSLVFARQSAAGAAEALTPAPSAAPAAVPFVPSAPASVPIAPPESGSLLPRLPNVDFSWSGYFEALAILCFILALVLGVLWLIKRRGNSGFFNSSAPAMRLESRLALGPKKWLMMVRCQDRRLVLGVTEKSINLLTELYDQEIAVERQEIDAHDDAEPLLAKASKQTRLPKQAKPRGKDKDRQKGVQNEADDDMSNFFDSLLKEEGRDHTS